MKNSERHIKKKKPDTRKSYLVSYYSEHASTFSDRVYREIKNKVVEASSKKEVYNFWIEYVQNNPSILNIICLDDD